MTDVDVPGIPPLTQTADGVLEHGASFGRLTADYAIARVLLDATSLESPNRRSKESVAVLGFSGGIAMGAVIIDNVGDQGTLGADTRSVLDSSRIAA
jgi:hypothetical protein